MIDTLSHAVSIVDANPVGLLTTVGPGGVPSARWMAALASDGVRVLWCLSALGARKVEHIRANPRVCWVFTSRNHDDAVTLAGRASIIDGPMAVQAVWDRLAAITRQYTMSAMTSDDDLTLVAVETIIQRVELISPRLGIYQPLVVEFEPSLA